MNTNDAKRASTQGLPKIDRSATRTREPQLSAFIDKVMVPQLLLSPDERIAAAIEEIKLAYREKWPDAPIYVRDLDNIDDGAIIILTNIGDQARGTIEHERCGAGWRKKGGEQHLKGGAA